jgi:diacylglycerol kinase
VRIPPRVIGRTAVIGKRETGRGELEMAAEWWDPKPADVVTARPNKPRRWRDKFREAFRGVKLGVRGHSSFFVHFFFAALAVTAAGVLQCSYVEWCLVLGCIGAVITAELFNSAIETLFHGLDPESKARIQGCLDVAAGAVLVAGLTAAVIGTVVFARRVLVLLHWLPAE